MFGLINMDSDVPYFNIVTTPIPSQATFTPYSHSYPPNINHDDWVASLPFTNNTIDMPISYYEDESVQRVNIAVKFSLDQYSTGGTDFMFYQGSVSFRMHPPSVPRMDFRDVAFSGRLGGPESTTFAIGPLSRLVQQYRSAAVIRRLNTNDGEILYSASSHDLESFCVSGSRLRIPLQQPGSYAWGAVWTVDQSVMSGGIQIHFGEIDLGKNFAFPRVLALRISELMSRNNQGMAVSTVREGFLETIYTHCDISVIQQLPIVEIRFGDHGHLKIYPEDYMVHDADANECLENFVRIPNDVLMTVDLLKIQNINILITEDSYHLCDTA